MQPAAALRSYLAATDAEPDILVGTLLVASHAKPELDPEPYLALVRDWAATLRTRIPGDAGTQERLVRLNHYLFDELGFRGNDDDYYDPRNSLMHEVIERRTGIPITLAVIYMSLARHIGLDLEGVSFPGHFLVKLNLDEHVIVLDPYHGGISLGEDELLRLLRHHHREADISQLGQWLASANSHDILLRLLRNLKLIYLQQQDHPHAIEIYNMLLAIDPGQHEERRERGLLLRDLECNHAALKDLSLYLDTQQSQLDEDESEQLRTLVLDLRRDLRPLH
ncbi:MAG: SirB1 family protein [Thiotrichales bacterium]